MARAVRKQLTLTLDPRVVVSLDYDADRGRATATISFSSQPPDASVMEAQAETVPGVKYASGGLGDSNQELAITLTAYHARTRDGALSVVRGVLAKLKLTAIGGIQMENDPPQRKKGKKAKKRKK